MSRSTASTTTLSRRFLVAYALTYLVLIGLMGVIVDRSTRSALIADVDDDLVMAARLAQRSVPGDAEDYQRWARGTFEATGFRTTLIGRDGVVLADSHSDPAVLENHGSRPEVLAALDGEIGMARRVSGSTGFEQRYVALPPADYVIVRTSVATRVVQEQLGRVRQAIVATAVLLGLAGVVVVAYLARRLARPISDLTAQARAAATDGASDVMPERSRVRELDELGLAISAMGNRLGTRASEAEEASATLEVVLGALPQGTVLFGGDDRVVYANPSAYSILGGMPDDLSGLAPFQFQGAVREARRSRQQETRVLDHGTPTRRLRGVATPFVDDLRVLLLIVDVTERERTDSIRRDFVANASHELKTPVSTIIASAEALQISLDRQDGSAGGFAERIATSARQLDRLVGDLLDLSRLERETPEIAPVRLDHLVREEVERIKPEATAKKIDLEVDAMELKVPGNHRDLATAVRNLLDNAVRYTPEGGSISVAVTREGPSAFVSVADTGEGIPMRDTERVFERFYRVDTARSRTTGGTGLGLSIVKHVVESHGGGVSVQSELGSGSTFTIRLPVGIEGGTLAPN